MLTALATAKYPTDPHPRSSKWSGQPIPFAAGQKPRLLLSAALQVLGDRPDTATAA